MGQAESELAIDWSNRLEKNSLKTKATKTV
jgi:hypothetical protein